MYFFILFAPFSLENNLCHAGFYLPLPICHTGVRERFGLVFSFSGSIHLHFGHNRRYINFGKKYGRNLVHGLEGSDIFIGRSD